MNVIWKEKRCGTGGGGADIELVFTPSDIVKNLDDTIIIGISLSRLGKKEQERN